MEKISRLQAQIEYLKIENEFLKKLDEIERGGCLNKSEIFEAIKLIVEKYKLKSKIKFLCLQASVSRSGYYNYFKSKKSRNKKEVKDLESKGLILKAFNRRDFKKG